VTTRPQVAVICHPDKLEDPPGLRAALQHAGLGEDLLWFDTTATETGAKQTREAVAAGAGLILVVGGDGTVAECAGELVDSGIPLAVVPGGTGNLLARNLDIPLDVKDAVAVAVRGHTRPVDLLDSDGRRFVVMAGLGFDAAMIHHTNSDSKAWLGWAAYLIGGVKALRRTPRARYAVTVDGTTVVRTRALGVLVGNVGRLQAGVRILPDADPHDGLLDVIILTPRRWRDHLTLLWRIARRRPGSGRQATVLRGRSVQIHADRPVQLEFDGEHAGHCVSLAATVLPAAVQICC